MAHKKPTAHKKPLMTEYEWLRKMARSGYGLYRNRDIRKKLNQLYKMQDQLNKLLGK